MEITGELKQNGIPSPEKPIEIENEIYIIKDEKKIKLERTDMIRLFEQDLKSVTEKEKTADELFKELGYEKSYQKSIYNKVWGILYENKKSMININFDMGNDGESDYGDAHMVCVYIKTFNKQTEPAYITMQELKAINKKVEELKWN